MTKYVFVTGGVVSSLGKGIAAASLGAPLQNGFSLVSLSDLLVPANEGIAFPTGTMDTFTTYGGPANLLETANTIGLPLYARQHLDEKGRWIDVMTEASILPVNKRPRLAIRLHTSN